MEEFHAVLRTRIADAERSLLAAQEDDDLYAASVHTGELEALQRLASQHAAEQPAVIDLTAPAAAPACSAA